MEKGLKTLLDSMGVGRREFLAGATVMAGFALAAQPVGAQTVITDGRGIVEGMRRALRESAALAKKISES